MEITFEAIIAGEECYRCGRKIKDHEDMSFMDTNEGPMCSICLIEAEEQAIDAGLKASHYPCSNCGCEAIGMYPQYRCFCNECGFHEGVEDV